MHILFPTILNINGTLRLSIVVNDILFTFEHFLNLDFAVNTFLEELVLHVVFDHLDSILFLEVIGGIVYNTCAALPNDTAQRVLYAVDLYFAKLELLHIYLLFVLLFYPENY